MEKWLVNVSDQNRGFKNQYKNHARVRLGTSRSHAPRGGPDCHGPRVNPSPPKTVGKRNPPPFMKTIYLKRHPRARPAFDDFPKQTHRQDRQRTPPTGGGQPWGFQRGEGGPPPVVGGGPPSGFGTEPRSAQLSPTQKRARRVFRAGPRAAPRRGLSPNSGGASLSSRRSPPASLPPPASRLSPSPRPYSGPLFKAAAPSRGGRKTPR
jgi:hypothetical protein